MKIETKMFGEPAKVGNCDPFLGDPFWGGSYVSGVSECLPPVGSPPLAVRPNSPPPAGTCKNRGEDYLSGQGPMIPGECHLLARVFNQLRSLPGKWGN